MALYAWDDPRRYMLPVMTVALIGIVPLGFGFVIETPFGTNAGVGQTVTWAVLGLAMVASVVAVFMIVARATRLGELEHKSPGDSGHK